MKYVKTFEEFITEKSQHIDEAKKSMPDEDELKDIAWNKFGFQLSDYDEDDNKWTVLATRQNGNVGSGTPGRQDIKKAKELSKMAQVSEGNIVKTNESVNPFAGI